MNLKEYKRELRKKILNERDRLSETEVIEKSKAILENLWTLNEFLSAEKILLFVNFRSEVRTIPIIEKCFLENRKVILPVTDIPNKMLHLYNVKSLDELKIGAYNILEPDPFISEKTSIADIDCVIVPGTAFDETGGRMGYGGGFYDRLLSNLRKKVPKIGLAFELQIIEKVPMGYYDQKVDIVVTEKRIIRIR